MRLAVVFALLTAACSPEIGSGTYFCGPERLCPPDLTCDDTSYTCVTPASAMPFSCPAGFDDTEPDSDMANAQDLGQLECGVPAIQNATGCVVSGDAGDYYTFVYNQDCQGANPHLEIRLRYPIALVPLQLELLDGSGTVLTSGELCTSPIDTSGHDRVCIDIAPVTGTTYYVRVVRPADAPNCNGDCDSNQYLLDILFPLSGS